MEPENPVVVELKSEGKLCLRLEDGRAYPINPLSGPPPTAEEFDDWCSDVRALMKAELRGMDDICRKAKRSLTQEQFRAWVNNQEIRKALEGFSFYGLFMVAYSESGWIGLPKTKEQLAEEEKRIGALLTDDL